MKQEFFIKISPRAKSRRNSWSKSFGIDGVSINQPSLANHQAVFRMTLTVPDTLFDEIIPAIIIDVPDEAIARPIEIEAEVQPLADEEKTGG